MLFDTMLVLDTEITCMHETLYTCSISLRGAMPGEIQILGRCDKLHLLSNICAGLANNSKGLHITPHEAVTALPTYKSACCKLCLVRLPVSEAETRLSYQ